MSDPTTFASSRAPLNILSGTSGYSYKEWKGKFYPQKLANHRMLEFYAQHLPAVEINNTFYRLPKPNVLQNWAAQVPETFRFSIKASQRITHKKRLRDAGEETAYLFEALKTLGERLGVVLFQLPPYLRKDVDRLAAFTRKLPASVPVAFEFRHESWHSDEVLDLLRDAACAWCVTDAVDGESPDIPVTAKWAYVRLRRERYSEASLRQWKQRLREHDFELAYVFFKHEDEAGGPELAQRFLAL